ncbi:AraC family transcriptional regulator [Kribbella sp. NPDC005582]|uniref:helix-turn-helix domain-containing protein n=1 Tax=Kribbella sp. NPDC005582 TaxID=3156893 RepID=UPI0033B048E2
MIKNGQLSITALPYRAGVGAPPGVEVLDFDRLLVRATGHGVDPYDLQRPEFHKLITVRSGELRCSLDFIDYTLGPGSLLWVRPGQVHRYDSDLGAADGRVVLFLPDLLSRTTAHLAGAELGIWQPASEPASAGRDSLAQILDLLEQEYARWSRQPSQLQVELLRHLLATLVLRLTALNGSPGGPDAGGDAFLLFREAVEERFSSTRRVDDYANQLGYSVRTLTRASLAAVGHGAKQYIDDRVLLEAKRLLVHTDLPAAAISHQLGFAGATIFTKFFRHRTGQTPTEFRARGA